MTQQAILGFHQDEYGDWVAELACGHTQHVRHRPPWELRPWVATERAGGRIWDSCCSVRTATRKAADKHFYRRA